MARILIVDDSAVARKSLRKIFLTLGHTVVGEAADGTEALACYTRFRPDVVTMDLTMEAMSGTEAISNLLTIFPEARIIVISSTQNKREIFDALERGARYFMIKPIMAETAEIVLNRAMQPNFDRQKHLKIVQSLKASYAQEKRTKARILIVDDSAVTRKILRQMVEKLGYEVAGEAANGSQAFLEYTKLNPDLVTMDLTMQGMDGAEAISKIVSKFPEARIVVVSSSEERRAVTDALERGARHFIVKPIRQEKVALVFHNVLQQNFDPELHRERVRRLRKLEESTAPGNEKYTPPYRICAQGHNMVHVLLHSSLSLRSYQSLLLELEEYLNYEPHVVFDFGQVTRLDQDLIIQFNELIERIENANGRVRAISGNKYFIDFASNLETGRKANLIADILQYWVS